MTTLLGIFAKQPVVGSVKTRLGATIGNDVSARFHSAFVTDILSHHASRADRRVLAFAPDNQAGLDWARGVAEPEFETWPQSAGDLGDRVQHFFATAFGSGAERVVLIGSDSPNLPPETLNSAFQALAKDDVVIGPSDDGGYYLIGQRAPGFDLFSQIDWSTSQVLSQTQDRALDAGATVTILPQWYDVDTITELNRLRDELASAVSDSFCQNTRQLLDEMNG